jgi:putative endonuclease
MGIVSAKKKWEVYIVRCSDNTLYTGITMDIEQRLRAHNEGRGSKYTRSRRPVTLVWQEPHANESSARRREYELKRWPRAKKLTLLQ